MKKFFVFSILLAVLSSPFFSSISIAAEEEGNRTAATTEEPNEKLSGRNIEAAVGAYGHDCGQCIGRLHPDKVDVNTLPSTKGSQSNQGNENSSTKGKAQ